jgi:hypothetical protein
MVRDAIVETFKIAGNNRFLSSGFLWTYCSTWILLPLAFSCLLLRVILPSRHFILILKHIAQGWAVISSAQRDICLQRVAPAPLNGYVMDPFEFLISPSHPTGVDPTRYRYPSNFHFLQLRLVRFFVSPTGGRTQCTYHDPIYTNFMDPSLFHSSLLMVSPVRTWPWNSVVLLLPYI